MTGAFAGLNVFYKHLKKKPEFKHLTLKQVNEWKYQNDQYGKFKPTKKKFLRRQYKIINPNNIWEGNLLDMQRYARTNKGLNYILNVIDQFTKKTLRHSL